MYNVSVSPHIRDKSSTQKIMIDVCIALIPTLAFGVWQCVNCNYFIGSKLCIE